MSYTPSDIAELVAAFQNKKIVLCPTDSIWGISCLATDNDALERIVALKNRPINKSFIVLFPSLAMAESYFNDFPKNLVEPFLIEERPTTIIVDGAKNLPTSILGENESLAFRIPKKGFCQAYMLGLNQPIVSTSANLSGQPNPMNYEAIDSVIKNEVDYIAKPDRKDSSARNPSKIIKLTKDGIKVLRT